MSAKRPLRGSNYTVFILAICTMVTASSDLAQLQAQSCTTYSIVGIPAGTTLGGSGVVGPVMGSTTVTDSFSGSCNGSHTQSISNTSAGFIRPGYITQSRGIRPNPFELCNGQIVPQVSGQVEEPFGITYKSSSLGSVLTETEIQSSTGALVTYQSVYDVKLGTQSITFTENIHESGTDPAGCSETLDQSTNYSGSVTWPINPPPPPPPMSCDVSARIKPIFQRALNPDGTVNLTLTPWASDPYDGFFCRTGKGNFCTIGNSGCNMIVTLMALKFADPTLNTLNPTSFNNFLDTAHDYTENGGVMLDAAVRDTSKALSSGSLKLNTLLGNNEIATSPSLADLDGALCKGFPVILGVDVDQTTNVPGHYILVTGVQSNGDHLIIDPGSVGNTSLATSYDNKFVIRGYVADPAPDISALDLFTGDTTELLVINSTALGTGYDGNSHQIRNEIPNAYHFSDSLQDKLSIDPPSGSYHSIGIFQPAGGTYKIVLTGLKIGLYTLYVRSYSQDGTSQPELVLQGIAGSSSTTSYDVQFASTSGARTTALLLSTFPSTLADITNCLQLGLIDNAGIANSLSQKIQAAQNATGPARNNILNAFENEVNAQSGKHITSIAPQVFLRDADSLISQNQ